MHIALHNNFIMPACTSSSTIGEVFIPFIIVGTKHINAFGPYNHNRANKHLTLSIVLCVSISNWTKTQRYKNFHCVVVRTFGQGIGHDEFHFSGHTTRKERRINIMFSVLRKQLYINRSIMSTTIHNAATGGVTARTKSAINDHSCRCISIGTDMVSSIISLQKARPWYTCAEEGSNMATTNAVYLKDLFTPGKTVAMFGVPAPFTGTCTHQHYPAYKQLAEEILSTTDCTEIICYAVTDPYTMNGWEQSLHNDSTKIRFLSDPDATFAKAYGIDKVYDEVSLGLRSIRFSTIIVDGIVKSFRVVTDAETDAQELLNELREIQENK